MIHSKSKRLVREEPIENILYKDALRRQAKKQNIKIQQKQKQKIQRSKKNFSNNSE